ncbi:hypothetical protein FQA39_LY08097 [Lamprigera yunnana]|nr:hypothetical protein FQA39_LY08097 [Lamprigera yunnana]
MVLSAYVASEVLAVSGKLEIMTKDLTSTELSLQNELSNLKPQIEYNEIDQAIKREDVINEVFERQRLSNNIIIYNLSEDTGVNPKMSVEQHNLKIVNLLNNVLTLIHSQLTYNSVVQENCVVYSKKQDKNL